MLGGGAKTPRGDTAAMVAARTAFLEAGHYTPIRDAVIASVLTGAGESPPERDESGSGRLGPLVLDLAAGNGYYLAGVLDAWPGARGLAMDASAAAARRAARCHPRAGAVTADAWSRLPLRQAAITHAISIFGPRGVGELTRVVAAWGAVTVVVAAPGHLAELRAEGGLLGIGPGKPAALDAQMAGFALEDRQTVEFTLDLDRPAVVQLIGMGPNAFHLSAGEIAARAAAGPERRRVTASVLVARYARSSPPRLAAPS
jgi:23S rRNA (guanine745-N1)-methyltransferase